MSAIIVFLKSLWAPLAGPAVALLLEALNHAVALLTQALNELAQLVRLKLQMA